MALSLGDIRFGMEIETGGLSNAITKIRQFGLAVERAANRTVKGAKETENQLRAQERAMVAAIQRVANFNQILAKSNAKPAIARANVNAVNEYVAALSKGPVSALQFQRAQTALNATLQHGQRRLKEHQQAIRGLGENVSPVTRAFQALANAAVLITGPLGGLAARITVLNSAFNRGGFALTGFIAAIGAAGYAVAKLSGSLTRTAIDMDRIRNRLEIVSTSTNQAAESLNYIRDVAYRTGGDFVTLANQFTRMSQATKGTSLEGERFREVFSGLALASAKFQLTADETQGVLKAFEQIISKGTVQAEELRGQLGDRLVGAFNIAATAMGKTTEELNRMIKAGEVASTDFIPKFVKALLTSLGLEGTESVESLRASISRLGTATTDFNDKLGRMLGVGAKMMAALDGLSSVLKFLTDNMENVTAAFAAAATAGLVLVSEQIIGGLALIARFAFAAAKAVWSLNAAMLANPAGRVIQILTKLGLVIVGAVAGFEIMKRVIGEVGDATTSLSVEIDQYIRATEIANRTKVQETEQYIENIHTQIREQQKLMQAEADRIEQLRSSSSVIKTYLAYGPLAGVLSLTSDISELEMQRKDNWTELVKLALQESRLQELKKKQQEEILRQAAAEAAARRDALSDQVKEVNRAGALARATLEGTGAAKRLQAEFEQFDAIEKMHEDLVKIYKTDDRAITKFLDSFRQNLEALAEAEKGLTLKDFGLELDAIIRKTEAIKQGPAQTSFVEKVLGNEATLRRWKETLIGAGVSAEETAKMIETLGAALEDLNKTEFMKDVVKTLIDVNHEINLMVEETKALSAGTSVWERWKRDTSVTEAVQDLTERLLEQGVALDVVADVAGRYWEALQRLVDTEALSKHLSQLEDMQDSISVFQDAARYVERYNLAFDDAKAVAEFALKLEKLGKSQEEINRYTAEYLRLLDQLNEAEAKFEGMKLAIEGIEKAWSDAFDSIGSSIVDALADGKNLMESLANIAKQLGKELVNLFLQLAIINPIKNQVLNPSTPYPTVGGFLGGAASSVTQRGGTPLNPLYVEDVGVSKLFGGGGGGLLSKIFASGSGTGNLGASAGGLGAIFGLNSSAGAQGTASAAAVITTAIKNSLAPATMALSSSFGEVQKTMIEFFSSKGLKDFQIAGILGNADIESRFNPFAVGDNGTAFGLFQHRGPRAEGLFEAVGGRQNLGDIQKQLEFSWKEMLGTENSSLKRLLESTDVEGATKAMIGFERPSGWSGLGSEEGVSHFNERLESATQHLEKMRASTEAVNTAQESQKSISQAVAQADQTKALASQTATAADQQKAIAATTSATVDQTAATTKAATTTAETSLGAASSTAAAQVSALGAAATGAAASTGGGGFFSFFKGIFGFKKGGAWNNGVRYAAKGMMLNGPTIFGTSAGPVMGGEAGTEAILPLTRGPDGKLGVTMPKTGKNNPERDRPIVFNQTINARDMKTAQQSKYQMAAEGYRMLRRGAKFA